MLYTKFYTSS